MLKFKIYSSISDFEGKKKKKRKKKADQAPEFVRPLSFEKHLKTLTLIPWGKKKRAKIRAVYVYLRREPRRDR